MALSEMAVSPSSDPTVLLIGSGPGCDVLFETLQSSGVDIERARVEVACAACRAVVPDLCVIIGDVFTNNDKGALQRLFNEQALSELPILFIGKDNSRLRRRSVNQTIADLSSGLPFHKLADTIKDMANDIIQGHHFKLAGDVSENEYEPLSATISANSLSAARPPFQKALNEPREYEQYASEESEYAGITIRDPAMISMSKEADQVLSRSDRDSTFSCSPVEPASTLSDLPPAPAGVWSNRPIASSLTDAPNGKRSILP